LRRLGSLDLGFQCLHLVCTDGHQVEVDFASSVACYPCFDNFASPFRPVYPVCELSVRDRGPLETVQLVQFAVNRTVGDKVVGVLLFSGIVGIPRVFERVRTSECVVSWETN
jgi:hypothetical protein